MAEEAVIVRYEELDDHGHSTLVVHGEPEVVAAILALVLVTVGAAADEVRILDPETGEEIALSPEDEVDSADEPGLADAA